MILKDCGAWGEIRGKLSLTPEQAWEMFRFKMKPTSRGIVIRKIRGKLIIGNLMIYGKMKTTKHNRLFGKLSRLASLHMHDIIYPDWENLTKHTPLSGYNLFIKINAKSLLLQAKKGKYGVEVWRHLLVSKGPLPTPKIWTRKLHKNQILIKIHNPENYMLGTLLFYPKKLNLIHILPTHYPTKNTISYVLIEKKTPVIFIYFKDKNLFSNSLSIVPNYRYG